MTKITLVTKQGGKIPLAELEIQETEEGTLEIFGTSEGGVGLLIGYGIKAEF